MDTRTYTEEFNDAKGPEQYISTGVERHDTSYAHRLQDFQGGGESDIACARVRVSRCSLADSCAKSKVCLELGSPNTQDHPLVHTASGDW